MNEMRTRRLAEWILDEIGMSENGYLNTHVFVAVHAVLTAPVIINSLPVINLYVVLVGQIKHLTSIAVLH